MAIESRGDGDGAEYLDVLLLCAAPLDVRPALNLAVEVANFEAEVRRSPVPIRLRRVFPPTFEQLRRELAPTVLQGREPRVFHFLGHGEEDYLWFEDEEAGGEKVTAARLRRLFEGTPIRLALLNACWSATPRVRSLCTHLVEDAGLAAAIGHGKPVADASAIAFARRFYAEITRGETVRRAYLAARNALAEKGQPGAAEIDLTGDGDLRLDEGLAPGERTGRVEDGMPTRGYLPGADFFCGREEEFRAVSRALADPDKRGYGLWGMGGIGKTALAKEAARRNAWRFRDGGVVFVDAREIAPPTTIELLRRALARLDPAARGDDPVFELVAHLTAAPGLIVLDNLDTLPETEFDALARFVAQTPRNGSHVLLTARAPIRPIEALPDLPTRLLTTGLHDFDGAFYAHRLAETKGVALLRDDPVRVEAGEVRGLCARLTRRVSGHPRMIEVAVGIARRGQAELDKALDRLTGDLEAKLTEMLTTGLALVGDEGRRLLAFLPLFPAGNFQPEAMHAACAAAERAPVAEPPPPPARPTLWGRLASRLGRPFRKARPAEPVDETDEGDSEQGDDALSWVVEGIRQLERGGFLDRDQQRDLCTFHQTLRDYGERETDLLPERYSAGFFGLLLFYAGYLLDNSGNYEAIDRCLDNALAVMETAWSARREPGPLDAVLATMVDALGDLFDLRGLWQLGDRWNERAIALRRGSDSARDETALANELFRRAALLRNRGQYEEVVQLHRESLQLNEKAANLRGQAASLDQLAWIELAQGNPAEARRLLQRSFGILEGLGDLRGQAASLDQLAIIESAQGNPAEARRLLQRSLGINEGLGALRGQAASLDQLASIELAQGNPAEARRLLQRSLGIFEGLGDLQGQAHSMLQLTLIESAQGNLAEARRLLQRSLGIAEGLGDLQNQAASLHSLAIIELAQGNPAEARRLLQRSLGINEGLGALRGQAASLLVLAVIESVQGNPAEARRLLQRSLGILEGLGGELQEQASILDQLARIELAQGNPAEARRLLQRSFGILEGLGDLRGQADSLHQLAIVESAQGNPAEARRLLQRSLGINEGLGDLQGQADSLHQLAIIESAQGNPAEARRLLQRSLGIFEGLGNLRRQADSLHQLAIIESAQGNPAEARRLLQQSLGILEGLGNLRGQAASLHVLAIIESIQGNLAEARRLLQQSLGIFEDLGDLRGQADSLLVLARIELAQGNPAEARRLLQRSLGILEGLGGELQEQASTLTMLAQLEAVEGDLEKALAMARESVRLLEGIGSAKAAKAREILADLEARTAGGSGGAPPLLAELSGLPVRAKAAGSEEGLAAIDAALEEARRQAVPSREVVALLARGVACWSAGDVAGCDESLRRAEEALARVSEAERGALAELVEMAKAQIAKSTAAGPKESDQLYAEAMATDQAGDMAGALGLFEASLAASRQEGDARGVAVNLLMIGQALRVLGRADEARERLREGLEVAQDLGDEELLRALQEAATVVTAKAEGAARGDDNVSER